MKSEEIQEDIERLQEKAYQAEQLEQLHEWAVSAEGYITDILGHVDLRELGIEEPHGWLSSNIHNLVQEIESKLNAL
tara:strand:- start:1965 stop:2195 length:231 start_codon:yes stop_codon:yes gene_type:complete